jgi:hypothetical protein
MQVLIDYNEKTRRYAVGEFTPPQAQRGAPNRPAVSQANTQPAMQEARDLDEALDIARNLFGGSQESAEQESFGRGYRRAAPLPFTDATEIPNTQARKY